MDANDPLKKYRDQFYLPMQKIYLDDLKTSEPKTIKQPKQQTLDNILAFSKSLEVHKSKNKTVELNLN